MLPKPDEVLDYEQCLMFVNRTFWQNRTQQVHNLLSTQLKNDIDAEE